MDKVQLNSQIKELARPSISKWMLRAGLNWIEIILIYSLMYYFNFHIVAMIVGVILLGTRQHALALLGHEAVHRNISKNKSLNNFIGNVFVGHPLLQEIMCYHRFHIDHHAHMLTDKDPEVELRAKEKLGKYQMPLTAKKRFLIMLTDLIGIGYYDVFHALQVILPKVPLVIILRPFITWTVVFALLISIDQAWIGQVWFVAIVTSYWAMFRHRSLTEHLGTDGTHILTANPLQRFFYLPHNTWYHYEHHVRADIPCWNLPKLRELLQVEPVSTTQLFQDLKTIK
jgi:fatty acid desaturase